MPPSRLSPDDSLRARLARLFTECVGLWGLFWVFMVCLPSLYDRVGEYG